MRPAPARRRTTPIVAGDVRAVSVHARQSDADRCCDRKAKGRAVIDIEPDQTASLEREIAKLRKINAALMSRVERSTDQQLNAFSLFETAISLDQQVRNRTQQLKQALQSLEKTNGDLSQPLNAARLTLSALAEITASPKGALLTDQIERSLATLEDLLRTLLDISRLDAGVLEPECHPISVPTLFEALRQEFAPVAAKRHLVLKIGPCARIVSS